tara:strand:- start:434 stop:709 length:276 start_codon:yes stop_codon:yes gene_type:complete
MAKKFNRVSAKKNKQKAKSRFKDSIILSDSGSLSDQNNSEIIVDQSEISVASTPSIDPQTSSYSFLGKEIINIGIITSVLLIGLIVTSFIA